MRVTTYNLDPNPQLMEDLIPPQIGMPQAVWNESSLLLFNLVWRLKKKVGSDWDELSYTNLSDGAEQRILTDKFDQLLCNYLVNQLKTHNSNLLFVLVSIAFSLDGMRRATLAINLYYLCFILDQRISETECGEEINQSLNSLSPILSRTNVDPIFGIREPYLRQSEFSLLPVNTETLLASEEDKLFELKSPIANHILVSLKELAVSSIDLPASTKSASVSMVHYLMAHESLRQATNYHRGSLYHHLNKMIELRKLVQAIYHALESVNFRTKSDDILYSRKDFADKTSNFEIPVKNVGETFRWAYAYVYRRLIERDESHRLERLFGEDSLKLELLNLFTSCKKNKYSETLEKISDPSQLLHILGESRNSKMLVVDLLHGRARACFTLGKVLDAGEDIKRAKELLPRQEENVPITGQRRILDSLECAIAILAEKSREGLYVRSLNYSRDAESTNVGESKPIERDPSVYSMPKALQFLVPERYFLRQLWKSRRKFKIKFTSESFSYDKPTLPDDEEFLKSFFDESSPLSEGDHGRVIDVYDLLGQWGDTLATKTDIEYYRYKSKQVDPEGHYYGELNIEEIVTRFFTAYMILRLGERLRVRNFAKREPGKAFSQSRRQSKLMILVALRLERICRSKNPGKKSGYFGMVARRTSDTHLLRFGAFDRERASNLILESKISRMTSTSSSDENRLVLEVAKSYLSDASRTIQSIDINSREFQDLHIETAIVLRLLASESKIEIERNQYLKFAEYYLDLVNEQIETEAKWNYMPTWNTLWSSMLKYERMKISKLYDQNATIEVSHSLIA